MGTIGLILLTVATGLAVFFWRTLNPAPQLAITDRGIFDRRLGLGWLDWNSIEGAYRPRTPTGNRVVLRVRVDERIGSAISKEGPVVLVELPLDLTGSSYSEVDVLQEVMARSRAAELSTARVPDVAHIPCR